MPVETRPTNTNKHPGLVLRLRNSRQSKENGVSQDKEKAVVRGSAKAKGMDAKVVSAGTPSAAGPGKGKKVTLGVSRFKEIKPLSTWIDNPPSPSPPPVVYPHRTASDIFAHYKLA